MARIIFKPNRGSAGNSDPKPIAASEPVVRIGQPDTDDIKPGTGESESEPIGSSSDDSASGKRVNGNGPRFVDPTSATTNSDGTPRRGRGRPRGSGSGGKRASTTQTAQDLNSILFSMHGMMAAFFKSEVFAISEDESEKLAKAVSRVTALYDIQVLPEKYMAWINLSMVGAGIYGPRFAAVAFEKKMKSAGPVLVAQPPPPTSFVQPSQAGAD